MTSKWIQRSIPIVAACVSLVGASFGPASASVMLQHTHAENGDVHGIFDSSGSITTMIDGSDFAITPEEWWKDYGFDLDPTVVVSDNGGPGSVVIGHGEDFVDVILYDVHEYPIDLGIGFVGHWPNWDHWPNWEDWPNWDHWPNWETRIDPGDPTVDTVPLPGAIVLMGSAIAVLLGFRRVSSGRCGQKTV